MRELVPTELATILTATPAALVLEVLAQLAHIPAISPTSSILVLIATLMVQGTWELRITDQAVRQILPA
jgi:hypothetical protein